jgi:hypothetical protein
MARVEQAQELELEWQARRIADVQQQLAALEGEATAPPAAAARQQQRQQQQQQQRAPRRLPLAPARMPPPPGAAWTAWST